MSKNDRLNVYEMYMANGRKADFFIQRESWKKGTVARVVSIGGRSHGALEGAPPYFGKPGVKIEIAYEKSIVRVAYPGHPGGLPNPETSEYVRVDKPDWWPLEVSAGA